MSRVILWYSVHYRGHPEEIRDTCSLTPHKAPRYYARFGGVPIGNRPIRVSVATVCFKLVRTRVSIGLLFLFNAGIPKKSDNSLLFSAVVFLPCISIQIIMMLGVMLVSCNSQCPQLFRVYYFRALCAVTEGASARSPDFFKMQSRDTPSICGVWFPAYGLFLCKLHVFK
jgi:hypothetical protein